MLGRVTNEQKELAATIPEKKERLERLKSSMANVDAFIEKAKRYTAIDELTPELLRLFIQRIEIWEQTKKYSRSAGQSVRIVYRGIGALDTPMREGDHAPHMIKEITEKTKSCGCWHENTEADDFRRPPLCLTIHSVQKMYLWELSEAADSFY